MALAEIGEGEVVEEDQREERSVLLCLESRGRGGFYRLDERAGRSGQVDGGGGSSSSGRARRGRACVPGIMADGMEPLAQTKRVQGIFDKRGGRRTVADGVVDWGGRGDAARASGIAYYGACLKTSPQPMAH